MEFHVGLVVSIDIIRWSCDIDMYICFYMVSVTITFEIFKLRYYVYCALFDLSCKLLLSIYLISAMCYTYYSTYYSSIFCLIYYRVVVKINLYQCQCQLNATVFDDLHTIEQSADFLQIG